LEYDIYALGDLLFLDYPSFRRHEQWYQHQKAVHKEGRTGDVGSVIEEFSAKMRLNAV